MSNKKGAIEFGWIFALIVGAIILFFAFYFIGTKLGEQKTVGKLGTESQLDILWSPFASFGSLAETSSKEFALKSIEKINFSCSYDTEFGYSGISVVTNVKTYSRPKQIYDKYIFSEKALEGKNFQVISKPFEMPWRVADLIYFIQKNKKYCFEDFPDNRVEEEFGGEGNGMNISNFNFSGCKNNKDFIQVCDSGNCDIKVSLITNSVAKKDSNGRTKTVYFSGDALMYAAIFSDPDIYDCNVRRLAKRIKNEAEIYSGKAMALASKGCDVSFSSAQLEAGAEIIVINGVNRSDSAMASLSSAAASLQSQNPYSSLGCRVF